MKSAVTIPEDVITSDHIETELTVEKQVELTMLRLDKIHPVISGNKWFKLKYYLRDANDNKQHSLLTFGGAFSNHIAATAYAAAINGFSSVGIIRGEEPPQWSDTLQQARAQGMELHFVSRSEYDQIKRTEKDEALGQRFNNCYIIPEGGFGNLGMLGAADIMCTIDTTQFTHIVVAIGTGTTIAGILKKALPQQQVIGISVMKNNTGLMDEITALTGDILQRNFIILHDYHFGGYAKKTLGLLDWMNRFYRLTNIPLDFVYTGKTMYGIFDMMGKNYFPPHSKILMIHTGGLQGNRSVKPGLLEF